MNEINYKQAYKTNWLVGIIIASSIPITLIVIGIFIEFASWMIARVHFVRGPEDTTLENAILLGGLYLALPCGLLNIVAGIFARTKDVMKKKFARAGIIIGILGICIGLVTWAFFIAVSSFEF